MQYSDLHIHSNYSDGILSVEEIIKYSAEKGLKYIAVTDHDTVESQIEIKNKWINKEVGIIPAIELSTEYKNKEVHILGYFIDIFNEELISNLNLIKSSRIERAKKIISNLNNIGIDIDYKDIEIVSSIGRPHIAKMLVEKGLASNTREAFQLYLVQGKPAYAERYKIPYKNALNIINKSGGISVLAHPGEIYKGISTEEIIKEFKIYGLKGIEVFHPSHDDHQINNFYNLAKKYSLNITGGSDCHGSKVNDCFLIGSSGLNECLTNKFIKQNINKIWRK